MKKKNIIICIIAAFIILTGFTWYDTAPSIKCNYNINGTHKTDVTIYLSLEAFNKLYYDEANQTIINLSNSTIYGYVPGENNIRFPTYGNPYQSTSGYTNYDLTQIVVTEVNNFKFYKRGLSNDIKEVGILILVIVSLINLFTR